MKIEIMKDRLFDTKKMAMIDYSFDVDCTIVKGFTSIGKPACQKLIKQLEDSILNLREIESELVE